MERVRKLKDVSGRGIPPLCSAALRSNGDLRSSMKSVGKGNRGHSRRRRNKRILLLAGILVIAGQLGVGLLLDHDPLKVRFMAADAIVKAVTSLSKPPDILFLGSSRFGNAVNTVELSRLMHLTCGEQNPLIVNAAFPGADPYSMHFLLRILADRGITPGAVVVEVSPETVKLAGVFQPLQVTRILTWKEMPEAASDLIAGRQYSRLLSSRLIPFFLYRQELLTYLVGLSPPYLSLTGGTEPHPASANIGAPAAVPPAPEFQVFSHEEQDAAVRRIQSTIPNVQKWLKNYRISGQNPRHLESMLAYLRAHNVVAILAGVPVAKVHFECYSTEINQKFLDYMNLLCRNYGCRFVDYRNRLSDDLFHDTHHLNTNGGIVFSRILQQEVLCEVWRNGSRVYQHAGDPQAPNPSRVRSSGIPAGSKQPH